MALGPAFAPTALGGPNLAPAGAYDLGGAPEVGGAPLGWVDLGGAPLGIVDLGRGLELAPLAGLDLVPMLALGIVVPFISPIKF